MKKPDFVKREEKLINDLKEYKPKRWRLNLPFRNYTLRMEDFIPAFAGTIGKVALVAAFAVSWKNALEIDNPSFITENVRLELVFAGLLTIIFCAVLLPDSGPPGTLVPLVPAIPIMAAAGVHPLVFGVLIGVAGLFLSGFKIFSKIVKMNGAGTKGGLLILFGIMGIKDALGNLALWGNDFNVTSAIAPLIVAGILIYVILNMFKAGWLVIPACAVAALAVAFVYGQTPEFSTGASLPIINPSYWWNDMWGIGYGFSLLNVLRAVPYVFLAIVLWPLDALAIKTIQDENYPKGCENAKFNMNLTYLLVSLRNIAGTILGGSQTAAIWRSFMIPLSIIRRPIAASALILGVLSVSAGLLGFPVDIAIYPPLLWSVLIFGVYVPMIEVGIGSIKERTTGKVAAVCIVAGIAVNPVVGWITATATERLYKHFNGKVKKDLEESL